MSGAWTRWRSMSPTPQMPKERTRSANRILTTQVAALLRSAMSMRLGSESVVRARKNGRHHRVGPPVGQQGKARAAIGGQGGWRDVEAHANTPRQTPIGF